MTKREMELETELEELQEVINDLEKEVEQLKEYKLQKEQYDLYKQGYSHLRKLWKILGTNLHQDLLRIAIKEFDERLQDIERSIDESCLLRLKELEQRGSDRR